MRAILPRFPPSVKKTPEDYDDKKRKPLIFPIEYCLDQVTPFGYPRIIACLQLPEDFRSLPRPSSPVGTKAFTVRPYLLHHIAKVFYHFHNTTKPFRDLLYCLISWYACFKLCIVVVFQLPTLLESNCFSAIVFFATQMSIFAFPQ